MSWAPVVTAALEWAWRLADVGPRARVRLSDGRTVKGRADPSLPAEGFVAGAPPPR